MREPRGSQTSAKKEDNEDDAAYAEVMRKVMSRVQGHQGESQRPNSIVEVLIDRMPTKQASLDSSLRQEDYMSPVAHAQMILNAYKAPVAKADGFMRLQQMLQVQSTDNTAVELEEEESP